MKPHTRTKLAALALTSQILLHAPGMHANPSAGPEPEPDAPAGSMDPNASIPANVEEARGRARLLHETIHGALQIMHRDFFDPDDKHRIPSASLEDVFDELAQSWRVRLHWLGVNAKTMDSDHEPEDDFEKKAVAALASGKKEFEAIEGNLYRRVGAIHLHNACLKCHVPHRTTLEDRTAALAISMPFGPPLE